MILTNYFLQQCLTDLTENLTSGGFKGKLEGAVVALWTAGPTLGPTMTWSQFTEAAFDGYARSAGQVWNTIYIDGFGNVTLVGSNNVFTATDGGVTETELGWALLDTTTPTPNLLAAELFATPVGITAALDGVSVTPVFQPPAAGWGNGAVVP